MSHTLNSQCCGQGSPTSVNSILPAGCGCNQPETVQDNQLTVVPGGSRIVQAPCPDACTPPSSAGAAVVQQPGTPAANCESYANSCLISSLQMVELDKTSTMVAICASVWALPGLELFFPGLGYVEVLGATNDVITYKNLTIEPGTQILAGTCFHHDAPGRSGANGGGLPNPEDVDASNTLDGLYGFENNTGKKILPSDGIAIVGCGGKWTKRQIGMMRFPITPAVIVTQNIKAGNNTFTVGLPQLPTVPACSVGFAVELVIDLFIQERAGGSFTDLGVHANGGPRLARVVEAEDDRRDTDNSFAIVTLGAADTTVDIETVETSGGGNADMELLVTAMAYHY